jgi:hypothetical protein
VKDSKIYDYAQLYLGAKRDLNRVTPVVTQDFCGFLYASHLVPTWYWGGVLTQVPTWQEVLEFVLSYYTSKASSRDIFYELRYFWGPLEFVFFLNIASL